MCLWVLTGPVWCLCGVWPRMKPCQFACLILICAHRRMCIFPSACDRWQWRWKLMKLDRSLLNNWGMACCDGWIMTAINPFTAKHHWLAAGPQHSVFGHACACERVCARVCCYTCLWVATKKLQIQCVCACVRARHFVNNAFTCMLPVGDYRSLNIPILINQEVKFLLSSKSEVFLVC